TCGSGPRERPIRPDGAPAAGAGPLLAARRQGGLALQGRSSGEDAPGPRRLAGLPLLSLRRVACDVEAAGMGPHRNTPHGNISRVVVVDGDIGEALTVLRPTLTRTTEELHRRKAFHSPGERRRWKRLKARWRRIKAASRR